MERAGVGQTGSYPKTEMKMSEKVARVATLLPQAFAWAREMNPTQPLTSGVWDIDTSKDESAPDEIQRIQVRESDVITFHNYSWPESFRAEITWLRRFHRPVICTEYMARPAGSTFDGILPVAKAERVGAINWGFVAGKTQTYYPWESWEHPYILSQPPVWFHEVLRDDGTPYRQAEVDLIQPNQIVFDGAGNLYGTTDGGGSCTDFEGMVMCYGSAFMLTPPTTANGAWTESVIYRFSASGLYNPHSGLIFDKVGNLYGTTYVGGSHGIGATYELTPPSAAGGTWTEQDVFDFDGLDGGAPNASVAFDSAGNLYGTTLIGGPANAGTVFELTPPAVPGGSWTETVL
jgi:uncharacterized repeat protein (TIGR03803 family)